jgi:hypothetical protein
MARPHRVPPLELVVALRAHVNKRGWASINGQTRLLGYPVLDWLSKRRVEHRRGELDAEMVSALESISGFAWDPRVGRNISNERHHRPILALLRAHVARHGWEKMTHQTVVKGVRLGDWLSNRRQAHRTRKLPAWLVEELEAIPGFHWEVVAGHHEKVLAALKRFVAEKGWDALPGTELFVDGVDLRKWVYNRRTAHQNGQLSPDLAKALEAIPGWSWRPLEEVQRAKLELLTKVVKAGPGGRTPREVLDDLHELGLQFMAMKRGR